MAKMVHYFIIPVANVATACVAPWSRNTLFVCCSNGLIHCVSRVDGHILRTWGTEQVETKDSTTKTIHESIVVTSNR
jgi:hypothetical protein